MKSSNHHKNGLKITLWLLTAYLLYNIFISFVNSKKCDNFSKKCLLMMVCTSLEAY